MIPGTVRFATRTVPRRLQPYRVDNAERMRRFDAARRRML